MSFSLSSLLEQQEKWDRGNVNPAHPLPCIQYLMHEKKTLAPWSLKMIPTSLETVIAAYFKVLFVFLFWEVCFYVFYKSSGSELPTMSSLLKATPTCCSSYNFLAIWRRRDLRDACRWCGGSRVSVLTAMGWEKQKSPSSHFLPLACTSHRVIHIHFCLYLHLEGRHIKK